MEKHDHNYLLRPTHQKVCSVCEKTGDQIRIEELQARIQEAIDLCVQYGGIDGAHHKDWVLDQMVRKLAGDRYEQIVKDACAGDDGPNTYTWDCGIAP